MPVRVVDLEWNDHLPTYTGLGEGSLLALVRVQGRPVGLARVPALNGVVHAERLRRAILSQVEFPTENIVPSLTLTENEERLSIIVCTRDRTDLLRGCLESLLPLAGEGHEVLIVDNAPSSLATAELVAGYPYRYILEPEPGLNRARNRGLANASHNLIAFTDDDCLPDPGWARSILAEFSAAQVGVVSGLVLPVELHTEAQERFEAYCTNRRIFQRRIFTRPSTPPSTAGAVGMGANMAFRKEALGKVGGFDPRFDGGTPTLSGGDTEIFARLLDAGIQLQYTPDALVWHRHPRDEAALRRVIFGYGTGLYAFLTKRLLENHDLSVFWTAPRWLAGPPLKALLNVLRGRPATPIQLLVMEFTGSLAGPVRYLAACRNGSPDKQQMSRLAGNQKERRS